MPAMEDHICAEVHGLAHRRTHMHNTGQRGAQQRRAQQAELLGNALHKTALTVLHAKADNPSALSI